MRDERREGSQRETRGSDAFTALGQGDDCALVVPAPGTQLAISTDMLVSGRHFLPDTDPYGLGHKALAVNLSDLAAMGAEPRAFTLALALPNADPTWLAAFSDGMYALAAEHGCRLIGGDTTRGPLTLSLTVFGEIPAGQALRRDGAREDDDIWVSGVLGDARLGLDLLLGKWADRLDEADRAAAVAALERPTPRVALGRALRGVATAALDLSDGLVGDLGHLMTRSGLGARVLPDALPHAPRLAALPREAALACMLAGGDDYELCFTAPPAARDTVAALSARPALAGLRLTRIGTMTRPDDRPEADRARPTFVDANGGILDLPLRGFDHFDAERTD
nr:thiamine-phosphate kinase [Chitinasiproducens palmae]